MTIKLMLPIDDYPNDHIDSPDMLIVSLGKDIIEKIKKVSTFVRENDLYCAQQHISSIDYYEDIDDRREPFTYYSIKDNVLVIKENVCFIKGSFGIYYIESGYFDVIYLEKLFRMKELPIEHMGMYINDKDENIRNIAMERLRGE